MPLKIVTPIRIFRHNGIDYADPAPSAEVERAVELLSTVNTELMNSVLDAGVPEDGKIVYSLKTAIGTKGTDLDNHFNISISIKPESVGMVALFTVFEGDGCICKDMPKDQALKYLSDFLDDVCDRR